jgi:hypothetical protein
VGVGVEVSVDNHAIMRLGHRANQPGPGRIRCRSMKR